MRSVPLLLLAISVCCVLLAPASIGNSQSVTTSSKATIEAVIQQGHSQGILSVAFDKSGRLALTGSADGTARLWDVAARRELRVFEGAGGADVVAFAPGDQGFALTAGSDGAIRMWNIFTGKLVRTLSAETKSIKALTFVGGGKFLVAGTSDGLALAWSMTEGTVEKKLNAHTESINAVASSPDGRILLTASTDRSVKVWDVGSWRLLRTFTGHTESVNAVAFSPDGRLAVSGSGEETTRLWEVATGREIRDFKAGAYSLAFSPDGRHILAGQFGKLTVLDIAEETPIRVIRAHELIVWSVAISPDGRIALSGSWGDNEDRDRFVARLWGIETGRRVGELRGHTGVIEQVSFSADGKTILTASEDTTARLWDLKSGRQTRVLKGHSYRVSSAKFSPDGRYVATASWDASLKLWDVSTAASEPRTVGEFGNFVTSLAFSADAKRLLVGSYSGTGDGVLAIYDVESGKRLRKLGGEKELVRSVALDATGSVALVAAFSTESGNTMENDASLLDTASGIVLKRLVGHTSEIMAVDLSLNGSLAVTGSKDRTARIWDVGTGRTLATLEGHGDTVGAVSFSLDGKFVLTGCHDNIVRLWETATGRLKATLRGHKSRITSVAFSPDGKLILTGSEDTSTRLWLLSTGVEIARMFSLDNDDWAVVSPYGRFDAGNLDEISSVSWVVSDNPLQALSPDTFTRDNYEPSLLPRLVNCHEKEAADGFAHACAQAFKPLRDLVSLNRIQPTVRLKSFRLDDMANLEYVEVEASGNSDPSQQNGKTRTGIYDVRLFRDGQLVGQWPEPDDETPTGGDIAAWRSASKINAETTSIVTHRFPVQLGSKRQGDKVRFTVYGFNEDRVRSEGYTGTFKVHRDIPRGRPRAYIVAVGVNTYQNPRLQLKFASADARSITTAFERLSGFDVVPVLLTSDIERTTEQGVVPAVDHARKTDIRDVLSLLAGKGDTKRPRLRQLLGPVVDKLAKVTPDDLVVISFSGHGHTEQGSFYLLPSDSGDDLSRHEAMISSYELTAWLRHIDAGEMIMIIDACHSAAGVPEGFKPGPMGDRGLGQLAYDKRMRILAATQADDVAIESGTLGQGLLTYALVKEALAPATDGSVPADVDGDRAVSMKEWLTFAQARVPGLYQDLLAGKIHITRDSSPNPQLLEDTNRHAQTPALFDFGVSEQGALLGTRK